MSDAPQVPGGGGGGAPAPGGGGPARQSSRRRRSTGNGPATRTPSPGPPRVPRVTRDQDLAAALLQVEEDEKMKINIKLEKAWQNGNKTKTRSCDDEWTLLIKLIYKRARLCNDELTWENILEKVPEAISSNISDRFTDEQSNNITNFLVSALKEASYKEKPLIKILNEEFQNRGEATAKNVQYYMKLNENTATRLYREVEKLEARQDEEFDCISSIGESSSIGGESKSFELRF